MRVPGMKFPVHPEVGGDMGVGCGERTGPSRREEGGADVDVRAPGLERATTCLGTPTTSGCPATFPIGNMGLAMARKGPQDTVR